MARRARCRIISEASRHLTDDLKARNREIPWQKVAGIGNVLRHDYENIAAPVIWKLVQRFADIGKGLPRRTRRGRRSGASLR
jgi:uncharacterized protein with HEPN domain